MMWPCLLGFALPLLQAHMVMVWDLCWQYFRRLQCCTAVVEVLEVFLLLDGMVGMESQQEDILLPSSWVIRYSFTMILAASGACSLGISRFLWLRSQRSRFKAGL
jgi:hypothetical protein